MAYPGDQWIVLAAFALDMVIGDPPFRHHPVRYMGRAITVMEPLFRRIPVPLVLSGGAMALILISITWAVVHLLLVMAGLVSTGLTVALQVVLVYFCLSSRGLEQAARSVYAALKMDAEEAARRRLAMIVGRDVQNLPPARMAMATVETVGENLVDGVLSPLFFWVLGGPALMMAYKMVNTLDSMTGYRNERYGQFGKIAARLDDAANYIPARLSVPVIALAGQILAGRGRAAMRVARREGRHHKSPNAGFPEAAFAGVLGVKLGGPNLYQGVLVAKPYIGSGYAPPTVQDIIRGCDLLLLSAVFAVAAASLCAL